MEKVNFTVKGKTYTSEEVRVGKIIDLWKLRSALSMGSYGLLYRMSLQNADDAIVMIDIEAFFTVFCPQFIDDIKPSSIRELSLEDYIELREVYVAQILPWMTKVEGLLKKKNDDA